ncbi:hypothetical protein GCM10010327_47730 [Streptomyces nitrosporeus]|nr:hypothetical protein GCM10010327_47730 [Streptomyces nitrosporeus]
MKHHLGIPHRIGHRGPVFTEPESSKALRTTGIPQKRTAAAEKGHREPGPDSGSRRSSRAGRDAGSRNAGPPRLRRTRGRVRPVTALPRGAHGPFGSHIGQSGYFYDYSWCQNTNS